jgi:hypothetical protein
MLRRSLFLAILFAFPGSSALADSDLGPAGSPAEVSPQPKLSQQARAVAFLALKVLEENQAFLIDKMSQRAAQRREREVAQIEGYVSLLPLLALLVVPIWAWRRGAFQRARQSGMAGGRAATRTIVASLCVAALMWGFVKAFFALEGLKTVASSWASPTQLLAQNALEHTIKQGQALILEHPSVMVPVVKAMASGAVTPDALIENLFQNAERVRQSWAFSFGYDLYRHALPLFEHLGSILLVILLLLFLRFSLPGARDFVNRISGDGSTGPGFGRTLFRYLRNEIFTVVVFFFPFVLVTIISLMATLLVTDFAARGVLENLLNAFNILLAREVSPSLVVTNFLGIVIFIGEVALLLLLANGFLLGSWLQMLHEKFATRQSFWKYRRFVPRFFKLLLRLYGAVIVVVFPLELLLDWLSDHRQTLGPTATLLVPLGILVVFNLGVLLLGYVKSLRMALDASAWRPPTGGSA